MTFKEPAAEEPAVVTRSANSTDQQKMEAVKERKHKGMSFRTNSGPDGKDLLALTFQGTSVIFSTIEMFEERSREPPPALPKPPGESPSDPTRQSFSS